MSRFPCTLLLAGLLLVPDAVLTAQTFAESDRDTAWYTVKGERHGISYFRQHRYPEVEYEAGERLTFDRYHTVHVMYTWLRRWADRYPDLLELYEVGKSFEGRPILQVTITNKETGKATDKPAAYFEGGRHAGEVTGSESVLWLIRHLLEQYGRDDDITNLIDTKTIYLRPQNNPDGSNLYLHTAQRNRSSVRPHDSDRDGLIDEDPNEDLDGDGVIYQLRWRARPDEEDRASFVLDDRDPTGRLMKRVLQGEGEWIVITEGIDNDGDNRFNEDGIGGLDLHRNYPENWRPDSGEDETRRGYTQFGAGAFPLSEPETRTTVLWLLTHPHVSVVNSMDTRVPMHLRPPSTSRSAERMYPEDIAYYERFDRIGLEITGYPWAGDVYETYMTRVPVNPVTGDPSLPRPLFGHGPDFGYFYYGSIWYGDELWNGGRLRDYNEDGLLDEVDALTWDDEENGGRGFREWEPLDHPILGQVEIGGFHPKFFSQNGPPDQLEHWASKQALFNLDMAMHLPQIGEAKADVRRRNRTSDSTTYEITVSWSNTGRLPTALRQAQLVKIVREDRVRLEFDSSLTRRESPTVRIVTPPTRDKTIRAGWTQPGERKSVKFEVRTYGVPGVEGSVHVLSTRGGLVRVPLKLGEPSAKDSER
ncbi:MAG: peptidase [Gemmatimonadales bacterium]|nr:peptidase [Gemmatimonadales bacterium]NIN11891.1 peptidase [Gemmatimonadales bacterium]NIN50441.1 peptidase [Gemmatimonadales bacterium]NIP07905.1 peptidase [Gemmatimonadales bacterium]NIR01929.1 peptidase [Gemmatimonadales bacterium]